MLARLGLVWPGCDTAENILWNPLPAATCAAHNYEPCKCSPKYYAYNHIDGETEICTDRQKYI